MEQETPVGGVDPSVSLEPVTRLSPLEKPPLHGNILARRGKEKPFRIGSYQKKKNKRSIHDSVYHLQNIVFGTRLHIQLTYGFK